jgi:hypothetical protein
VATRRGLAAVTEDATPMEFAEKEVQVRGATFKIRELSSGEYDKLYKQAESADGDLDTTILLRLMAHKCVVEPEGFTAEDLAKMPMRAARALLAAVNDLHFGDEDAKEAPKNA